MEPYPDLSNILDFEKIIENTKRKQEGEDYILKLIELANNGSVDAQFYLAQEYLRNSKINSTIKDKNMAFYWYMPEFR